MKPTTLAVILFSAAAHAGVIVEASGGKGFNIAPHIAQSVTTPSGGPWYSIDFSFLKTNYDGIVPVTRGDTYILSSPYFGSPGLLHTAPQIVAKNIAKTNYGHHFSDSVILQPNTTYWFYSTGVFPDDSVSAQLQGYGGGHGYYSIGPKDNFLQILGYDWSFRLSGLVVGAFNLPPEPIEPVDPPIGGVPEPATLATTGLALLLCGIIRRRAR